MGVPLSHRAVPVSLPFTAVTALLGVGLPYQGKAMISPLLSFFKACPRCPSDPGGKQATPCLQETSADGAGPGLCREELHDVF